MIDCQQNKKLSNIKRFNDIAFSAIFANRKGAEICKIDAKKTS